MMRLKLGTFDTEDTGLDDNQAKCFHELLLLGFDSQTALSAICTNGFKDVNAAVKHLAQQNKHSPLIPNGSLYSSTSSASSSYHNDVIHYGHIHKKRQKTRDGFAEPPNSPYVSYYSTQSTKKSKSRTRFNKHRSRSSRKRSRSGNSNKSTAKLATICTVGSCVSLANLIEVLVWYQTLRSSSNLLPPYSYKHLLNDFHHLLYHHLSIAHRTIQNIQEEFQYIYNEITKYIPHCEIKTCPSFIRNQRDRSIDDEEKEIYVYNDPQISFFTETLDSIHCYFLHSYHQGMRTKLKYRNKMMSNKKNLYQTHDTELKCITSIISAQTKSDDAALCNWRNSVQSKYFTKLPHRIRTKRVFRSEPKSKARDLSDYFGFRYYYHEYFRDNALNDNGPNCGYKIRDMYISQKYYDLKDELVNNRLFCLNINVVQHVITKAQKYSHTQYCKALYAKDSPNTEYFKIKSNQQIKMHHLMSIIFFCDQYDLCISFKSTFRKINHNETHQQIKNRHREFYHFARCLNETVQIFGHKISSNKTQTYFHGVNQITFPTFCVTFCGPTSCTPIIEVAVKSAIDHKFAKGVLLELVPENEYSSLMCFDCCWLSCYGNECEQLFFGGTRSLKFKTIRTLDTHQNYAMYIKAIQLFHNIIQGKASNSTQSEITENDYLLVQCLLKHIDAYDKYTNHKIPKYIHKLFKAFCASQKTMSLSLDMLHNKHNKGFKDCLLSNRCKNLVRMDFMARVFVNLKEIKIYNLNNVNDFFILSLVSMLEHMEGIGNLITVKLYDVQYDYQYLDHRFLSKFMMKFQLQAGCKISVDIEDRLIYDETHEMYTKYVEHTDLIIIRNSVLRKEENYKYFMASSDIDDSDINGSLDSGDTLCHYSSFAKPIVPLNRLSTV